LRLLAIEEDFIALWNALESQSVKRGREKMICCSGGETPILSQSIEMAGYIRSLGKGARPSAIRKHGCAACRVETQLSRRREYVTR
jgi:hypothetical protein